VTLPSKYPQANQTVQARPQHAGGGVIESVEKLCLHTTETQGWPGYPTFAPHLTYNPWTHQFRQHFTLNRSASTLADPSSTAVRENRDRVIQVEIVAYCDPALARKYGHFIDDIDDEAVRDLAELAAWLHKYGDLELALAREWVPYAISKSGRSGQRLSGPAFDAFRGVLGHEHVSGNDHLDPGGPPWLSKFLTYAKQAAGVTSTPAEPGIGPNDMGKDIYENVALDQKLVAGDNEVKINAEGDKTLVFGPSKGVDLGCVLDVELVRDEPAVGADGTVTYEGKDGAQVRSAFRVLSYKDGTPTTTTSTRRWTKTDSPFFKGTISADKVKGREPRLRLVVNVPKGYTAVVHSAQFSGFKKED